MNRGYDPRLFCLMLVLNFTIWVLIFYGIYLLGY